jgi:hypothetical protein
MSKLTIAADYSPATILSHEVVHTSRVRISYGGGMGGCNETYYTTAINKNSFNPMWLLTSITGEKIEVNPDYIVNIVSRDLVHLVTDITAWANYSKHTCEQNILTEYIQLDYGEEYEIAQKGTRGDSGNKIEGKTVLRFNDIK